MNSNLEISFLSLLAYAALYLFGFLIFVIIFLLGSKLAESVSQCGFFGIYSRVSLFRGQQLRLLRRGLIGVYQVFD